MSCASKIVRDLALALALAGAACGAPERPPPQRTAHRPPDRPALHAKAPAARYADLTREVRRLGRLGRRRETAAALIDLGITQVVLGKTEDALGSYREAREISRTLGDRAGEADALANMARAYSVLGKMEDALDFYDRELALRQELGQVDEEGYCLINRGRIYALMGDSQTAIDYFTRGLPLLRSAAFRPHAAGALVDLGRALVQTGRTREGIETIEESLRRQRRLGNPTGEAVALGALGSIHYKLGDMEAARRYYALQVRVLRQAGERTREAMALPSLGRLQEETGDLAGAVQSYSRALQLSGMSGSRSDQGWAWLGLARIRRRQGDLAGARQAAEQALDRVEALRGEPVSRELRASFLATRQSYYEFHVGLLMELGQQPQAFEVSEQARARSLLDALAETRADLRSGVDAALLKSEADLDERLHAAERLRVSLAESNAPAAQVAAAERGLRELLRDSQRLADSIRRASPRYAALSQAQPAHLQAIQRLLDPDTLLLEYALGKERSFLWAVTASSLASFTLPPRARIEDAAGRALRGLASRQQALARVSTDRALDELSRLLLGPVAGRLRHRLVIVGDGALHTLPFAVLPIPGRREPLIAEHEVLSLPSASTLAVLRRELAARPASPVTVAVLADPVYGTDDPRVTRGAAAAPASLRGRGPDQFAPLPFARQEAAAIRELVPTARRFEALDFAASRQTVMSGRLKPYRIVHFATHAVLDSKYPELSAIVLSRIDAKGAPVDGSLRVHDIYRLSLPADLVVLSACETALGQEVRGEGLIGLTRAFFVAGARRVLVSLWPVEDRATAELMRRFYRELLHNHRSPAAALQAAQNSLRQEPGWKARYYWAGFVLQGDWR
ncbi:MAG TPA: CHAT domain-containing protein [Thermoanaerobaculia bacterium]